MVGPIDMKNPSFSLLIKRCLCGLLFHSGLARRKITRFAKGNALILMYHRILPEAMVDESIEPGMYVSTTSFARHLSSLAQYFEIIPLDSIITGNIQALGDGGKPRCAITFDDGWLDFLLHAFPLLQQFNAPATVFLPTNFIGTDRKFWTDTVAELLFEESKLQRSVTASADIDKLRSNIVFQHLSQTDASSMEGRLYQIINGLKRHRAEDIYLALDELSPLGASIASSPRVFLNWEEVRSLKNSGLVTFGSHTEDHNILTTLHMDEVRRELSRSKKRLAEENATPLGGPLFFCYPNGNANNEMAALVQDAGYAGAVTTKEGWNACDANRFLLNRIGLHDDMSSSQAMFVCRLAGFI